MPIDISNIENIDDLIRFGRDFSDPDVQIAAIKRVAHTEEQTRKIIGKHFDDGEKTGTGIVHRDLMGSFVKAGFRITVDAHLFVKGGGQVQFADPEHRIGFGFVTNWMMGPDDVRATRIIDALRTLIR